MFATTNLIFIYLIYRKKMSTDKNREELKNDVQLLANEIRQLKADKADALVVGYILDIIVKVYEEQHRIHCL